MRSPNDAAARSQAFHPLKLLVVDDEELVLRSTARSLADFETVMQVRSAREALLMLENEHEFDVVVSDVMMPEMSGPELYLRCHAASLSIAERFVFASGDPAAARKLLAAAAREVGANHIPPLFEKPTPRDALAAAVCSVALKRDRKSGMFATQPVSHDQARVTNYRG